MLTYCVCAVDEMRGQISLQKIQSHEPPKTFTFDTVFGPDSKQVDVYNLTARPIVDSVLEGYNGKLLFQQLRWFCSGIMLFLFRFCLLFCFLRHLEKVASTCVQKICCGFQTHYCLDTMFAKCNIYVLLNNIILCFF